MNLINNPRLSNILRLIYFVIIASLSYNIVWNAAWFDGFGHGYSEGIFDFITDLPKAVQRLIEFQKEWE